MIPFLIHPVLLYALRINSLSYWFYPNNVAKWVLFVPKQFSVAKKEKWLKNGNTKCLRRLPFCRKWLQAQSRRGGRPDSKMVQDVECEISIHQRWTINAVRIRLSKWSLLRMSDIRHTPIQFDEIRYRRIEAIHLWNKQYSNGVTSRIENSKYMRYIYYGLPSMSVTYIEFICTHIKNSQDNTSAGLQKFSVRGRSHSVLCHIMTLSYYSV